MPMSQAGAMRRNARLILDQLEGTTSGRTRAELRELTGLSKPTVQSIVAELKRAGRIDEARSDDRAVNGTSPNGRPPERFVLTPEAGLVVGVDIGHGHLRAAVADRSG